MTTTINTTSLNPTTHPQTKNASSLPQSPRIKSDDEWNTWRQTYISIAAASAAPSNSETNDEIKSDEQQQKTTNQQTNEDEASHNKDDTDALEASRQWIINSSKSGALNDNHRLGILLHRLLCEQQEIMDRQVSKPWTITRPVASTIADASNNDKNQKPTDTMESSSKDMSESSSRFMLRQIEWHVVLLLELWIHHGERLVQEIYPRLLVLQHSRLEAQKKEDKEKRKWKRMNRPSSGKTTKSSTDRKSKKPTKKKGKKAKHGKTPSTFSKFSACAFIRKQLGKFGKVLDGTPSLTNRLQTATPQDKELQLLDHLSSILSQAAFFLPAAQNLSSFLTQKCLSLNIWKALPQVVTHVYEDLERVNPYLADDQAEDPFAPINILTTTKKKKKKTKKNKSKPKEEEADVLEKKEESTAPSRFLSQKKNRLQAAGGHFHHRCRATQSTMSKVLEHLSPVRRKLSAASSGSKGTSIVSNQKTPRNRTTTATSGSTGKSNKYLSRNSSQLVTPHGNKSAKLSAKKTPKLSLISTSSSNNKSNSTPSTTTAITKASKKPAPVTTAKKEDRPKLQLEPTKSIQRDEEFQLPTAQSPQKKSSIHQSPNGKMPTAEEEATMKRSRYQGLFPLSPIPTNRSMSHKHVDTALAASNMTESGTSNPAAVMKTPTRKRRSDALLTTPVRKPSSPLAADEENERNHGNRPPFLTPQRGSYQPKVAETPDAITFPAPKQRVACYATTTPVRRHSDNAVVAETPDTSIVKLVRSNPDSVVAETPQRRSTTVAETPQHPSITTTMVAETPESVDASIKVASNSIIGGFDSIDWEAPSSSSALLVEGGSTDMVAPMQLFAKPPKTKKPRRVYSLGGGKQQPKIKKPTDDKDELQDRRMATNAVLTQAMAFMRRKSLEGT